MKIELLTRKPDSKCIKKLTLLKKKIISAKLILSKMIWREKSFAIVAI